MCLPIGNLISYTRLISMCFILSFFFELVGRFLNIINLLLPGFSVSLLESTQLFSLCSSFPSVSESRSGFSPQPSKFVSPAYEIVFMVSETSRILFRCQINSNGPNTEPWGAAHSSFSSWCYTLPRSCSRHRMQIAPQTA